MNNGERITNIIRIGDKVTGIYAGATYEGIVDTFIGSDTLVTLTRDLDMGFRIEKAGEGICITRHQRESMRLVQVGNLPASQIGRDDQGFIYMKGTK